MTRIELIEFLGDFITKLDMCIASILPSNPDRKPLEDARDELDSLLLKLREEHFNENSEEFQKATEKLTAINKELKKTIDDISKVAQTLETITRFITAVEKIVSIAIP